ncbi:variant sh3 [Zalerion maritima]|uniref:Variant sh3 n=1 Tax=Zalerion maritima TaxID=339359 RepID=A0AAD5S598_9PEZI|nr:variant sh3 [Zalerion maritima]
MHSHNDAHHHRRNIVDNANAFVNEHKPLKKRGTIYRTVYKTLDPTFSGSVAGYTTIGKDDDDETTTSKKKTTSKSSTKTSSKKTTATTTSNDGEDSTSTSLQASITEASSSSLPTTLATKTTSDETLLRQATSTSGTSLATSSSSSSTESSSDSGSSGAAKAGIAIGVLGAILIVALGVFFIVKKRRNREQDQGQALDDDEKINGPFVDRPASVQTTRTAPVAPRLSLRPVTQFLPNLEKRSSKGAAAVLGFGAARSAQTNQPAPLSPIRSPGQSAWERPMTSDSSHVENPFGNHAERAQTPVSEMHSTAVNASTSTIQTQFPPPIESGANANGNGAQPAPASPPLTASTPTAPGSPDSAVVGVAGTSAVMVANGAAVASNLARKASMRKNGGPKPLDLTVAPGLNMATIPASPANTEFSINSTAPGQSPAQSQGAAAIAAAGGPNNSTVHRVQLDFAPTMEDEMELKAGQLVRLLHEYDDGWALCIRLDRSQQGVVPRTCLSARPVKPRPQQPRNGPPINPSGPGARGPGPQGRPGPNGPPGARGPPRPMPPAGHPRPMSPAGQQRPMSPAGRPGSRPQSPAGRPMRPQSPASGRPQSPASHPQSPGPRSRSPSGAARRNSPPGPSPMNPNTNAPPQQKAIERKPVPGQAL